MELIWPQKQFYKTSYLYFVKFILWRNMMIDSETIKECSEVQAWANVVFFDLKTAIYLDILTVSALAEIKEEINLHECQVICSQIWCCVGKG